MTLRLLFTTAAILALCACKPVEEAPPPGPEPKAATPAPVAAEPAPEGKVIPLTSDGFGALKIGMSEADAEAAIGGFRDGSPSAECHQRAVKDASLGLVVMFEEGRVSRISLGQGSPVQTDHAIGLGAIEPAVRAAYEGAEVVSEPHKYLAPPAKRLIHWDRPPVRGTVYEINEDGRVVAIYAGGPSIQYVEGCS